MTDGQRYAAGVDHEEGLKHDSTICWICAAIAKAVEAERERLWDLVNELPKTKIQNGHLLVRWAEVETILEPDDLYEADTVAKGEDSG